MIRLDGDRIWSDKNPQFLMVKKEGTWVLPWAHGHGTVSTTWAVLAAEVAEEELKQYSLVQIRDYLAIPFATLHVWGREGHDLPAHDRFVAALEDRAWKDPVWDAAQVADVASRLVSLLEFTLPDLGVFRAAEELEAATGVTVSADTIFELAAGGHIARTDTYKGHQLYSGKDILECADVQVIERAAIEGKLLEVEAVAERLEVRPVDVKHLIRAGFLRAVHPEHYDCRYTVSRYRAGDVDHLPEQHPELDWDAARNAPSKSRSPFVKLPDRKTV